MRLGIVILLGLTLLTAQVAGAWCACTDEADHGGAADARHDDDAVSEGDSHDSPDSDHHHGGKPSHCECAPVQPLAVPEASPIPTGTRAFSGWAPELAPIARWALSNGLEPRAPRQARPPPSLRGISSMSPLSLSKLQI